MIGVRLVPLLATAGHEIAGMTRSPEKCEALRELGATPVLCDVFDVAALRDAVVGCRPELVLHQLTDLPDDEARIPELGSANARMRRVGTANLLSASGAAGASPFLAQSVAWEPPGESGAAEQELERMVLDAGGTVLRYGPCYGPGTYHEDVPPAHPRIEIDEAARSTVDALEAPSGILEIVER